MCCRVQAQPAQGHGEGECGRREGPRFSSREARGRMWRASATFPLQTRNASRVAPVDVYACVRANLGRARDRRQREGWC